MSAPIYLQLQKGGVYARMFNLRMLAAQSKADNRPPSLHLADWRAARKYGFHNWAAGYCELSHGFNGEGYARRAVWYCHTGEQFRNERDCDRISDARIDHTGWFTDVDGDEKAIGIVGLLSHGRYIAGYRWTSNDERVYFDEVFDNEVDAARMADQHAEHFADIQREDDEKFQEARQLENLIEDSFTRLRECIALRHVSCMSYVRNEARALVATIRASQDDLKTISKTTIRNGPNHAHHRLHLLRGRSLSGLCFQ